MVQAKITGGEVIVSTVLNNFAHTSGSIEVSNKIFSSPLFFLFETYDVPYLL